ncbi:hypothetical protein H1R20_g10265, partial [Candolleomyces eurysporus]
MSFLNRIAETRKKELRAVRSILHAESANMALAHTVPYLAATLAFITYTRVTNEFDVAVVFASLALFQLLRQPMMFLPRGLSVIADARSALSRLDRVFHAELMQGDLVVIKPEQSWGLLVEDATFEWEEVLLKADGDLTEIGEKGINLSGGQKQRVNIARALYFDAEVIIMDDPLSAVDAHVGKSLFHGAIAGLAKKGKTVIFVTHALHFLSFCDYIYTLNAGRISEHGTYRELIEAQGEFARLDEEFGGKEAAASTSKGSQSAILEEVQTKATELRKRYPGKGTLEGKLIVKEARNTGTIANSAVVWKAYLSAGRGFITIPLLLLSAILMQGSQIISSYILVWWQANTFNRPFSFYQMIYAVLGVSQAVLSLLLGVSVDVISYLVSQNLHRSSIHNIFHAPMSFFDTTPLGRVLGVFGKDIDIVDNQLPISMRMLVLTVAGVIGSIVTIGVIEPYFFIVAVFVATAYHLLASFYRASAREIKRLDSMLRSLLYSHLSESLTGLSTLRSYGQLPRFVRDNEFFIDLEARAVFLAHTNQRWLTVRLDVCGGILVFFVALFSVLNTSDISPAHAGLILTFTKVENYMNAVERISHYSDSKSISQEPPHENPDTKPGPQWPEKGSIDFNEVSMKYRPGLPNVLHSISMSIKGGEKVGVVGRTGAGKSSLVMTLMRIVEYTGSITIDGVDISKLGLKDLRSKISIIPQDPTVFSGTVRAALDPFSLYDDARLWDALRRSFLVEPDRTASRIDTEEAVMEGPGTLTTARITLDTVLEAEGLNLSVGERSLLSLARALVKETKVVILDEATASVDLETDKKIQQTIQTEFVGKTLICIAHRLRTILGYDRILVLDAGNIASDSSNPGIRHTLDPVQ